MTNIEIVDALNRLDLSSYPYDEVMRLVSQFQPKHLRIKISQSEATERITIFR